VEKSHQTYLEKKVGLIVVCLLSETSKAKFSIIAGCFNHHSSINQIVLNPQIRTDRSTDYVQEKKAAAAAAVAAASK
jgi:hypothetical protein